MITAEFGTRYLDCIPSMGYTLKPKITTLTSQFHLKWSKIKLGGGGGRSKDSFCCSIKIAHRKGTADLMEKTSGPRAGPAEGQSQVDGRLALGGTQVSLLTSLDMSPVPEIAIKPILRRLF